MGIAGTLLVVACGLASWAVWTMGEYLIRKFK